eukprot:4440408-Pleurochrysis_carterae.AAC.3
MSSLASAAHRTRARRHAQIVFSTWSGTHRSQVAFTARVDSLLLLPRCRFADQDERSSKAVLSSACTRSPLLSFPRDLHVGQDHLPFTPDSSILASLPFLAFGCSILCLLRCRLLRLLALAHVQRPHLA